MLCAQYGNPLSYYGNVQYAFYNPSLYTWGAWELPYPEHYQPPLTELEERVIEEHRGNAPTSPVIPPPPSPISTHENDLVILRLQHEARLKEIASHPVIRQQVKAVKRKEYDDESDEFFILM